MSQRKSQHYVPVFYLKYFSLNNDKKSIGLFNIQSEKFISGASIKHQACRDYFYGTDGVIEASLASLEERAAEVLGWMVKNNNHPPLLSKEHRVILVFAFLLHARTLETAESLNEMVNQLVRHWFSRDPNFRNQLDTIKVGYPHPAQVALRYVAMALPLLTDLDFKIVLNATSIPFLTSDQPVVFYNQFFEGRRTWGSNTGLASKGLQVFFPISPKHLLIFFDKDVYKIYGVFHKPVPLSNQNDVNSINGLQFLNARSNIYFNHAIDEAYVQKLIIPLVQYRRGSRSSIHEYEEVGTDQNRKSLMVHLHKEDIKCNLKLEFIRWTKKARQFEIDNRAVYFRNEAMVRIFEEFWKMVQEGKYKRSQFYEFLKDRMKELG